MKNFLFVLVLLSALMFSANAAEGDYIIKYREDVPVFYSEEDSARSLGAGMYLVSGEKAMALKKAGMLEICEPDKEFYFCEDTNDDLFDTQWNIPIIKAEYAWSLKIYGNDVLVGVIDSGLDSDHPDIDYSCVEVGYNSTASSTDANYESAIYDTEDRTGHGTKVAGIIAAKRNNGIGLAGIADKTKIVPLRCVSDDGAISESSIINAIGAGAGYFGCDVLNISVCTDEYSSALQTAVNYAYDLGCIIVSSAGNNNDDHPGNHIRYPAGCEGVIAVGSTTRTNSRTDTSVVNESVFICAPASGIPVLNYSGNYSTSGGTSFAAPQVTAAAAIAKQLYPQLTPAQFAEALAATAYDLDTQVEGRDIQFGYGLLDIEELIKYVSALKDNRVYVSPFDRASYSVTLHNLTNEPVSVSSIICSYFGNGMTDYSHKPIVTLKSGASITHTLTSGTVFDKLRHFLWYSVESVKPYDRHYIPRELSVSAN